MKIRSLRSAGFTLIELLAVLLILSILVVILIVTLKDSLGAANVEVTRTLLREVASAVNSYANDNGAPPPSSFQPGQEVANDGTNVGIECLVVALFSKNCDAGKLLSDVKDKLVNTDGDQSSKQLTDFDNRSLLEIPDPWKNPIAYIEKSDYHLTNRRYTTVDTKTSQSIESVPLAFKNAVTGQYYSNNTFQLISAGPDGVFGTDDDITDFDRTENTQ